MSFKEDFSELERINASLKNTADIFRQKFCAFSDRMISGEISSENPALDFLLVNSGIDYDQSILDFLKNISQQVAFYQGQLAYLCGVNSIPFSHSVISDIGVISGNPHFNLSKACLEIPLDPHIQRVNGDYKTRKEWHNLEGSLVLHFDILQPSRLCLYPFYYYKKQTEREHTLVLGDEAVSLSLLSSKSATCMRKFQDDKLDDALLKCALENIPKNRSVEYSNILFLLRKTSPERFRPYLSEIFS